MVFVGAAIAQIGASARGVALVDTSVADAELKRVNDLGIRSIRFAGRCPAFQADGETRSVVTASNIRRRTAGNRRQIASHARRLRITDH
jgi:hypothetical protein